MWVKVDPENPPARHMVALYKDGSGAITLTRFDGETNFHQSEDGWDVSPTSVLLDYSWWAPAPEGFEPHFMTVYD